MAQTKFNYVINFYKGDDINVAKLVLELPEPLDINDHSEENKARRDKIVLEYLAGKGHDLTGYDAVITMNIIGAKVAGYRTRF